ncbi:hypothetical protein [Dechloromonas denitrificans]|uniref:hypothetical protein n=1 Tax=Dechloromonas denitrificans TaxID=281362 RepID=UPI001CF82641|nr:hypothetical protein [Dechloromonas denitrificans]UCV02318.1 hypothetical protein KI611_14630 [Dechloromonas denitrificans]
MYLIHEFSSNNGWLMITDFLRNEGTDNCPEERSLAGFSDFPTVRVGNDDGVDFGVRIYTRERFPEGRSGLEYKYLACIDIGDSVETVAIRDLPDLLEFMRQTVPLATTIDTWSMKRQARSET